MIFIRIFEEYLLKLFDKGLLNGTVHTCIGQEAVEVGIISNLLNDDIIFSSHRSHGHFISHNGDWKKLLLEILGHEKGLCGGKGGSQHLHSHNFYSSGIQGSYMPVSVGLAYSKKLDKNNNIVVSFVGDGTLGQGVFYESLNMASVFNVPLLIVIENNYIAQTTKFSENFRGDIRKRIEGFDIEVFETSSNDVEEISRFSNNIIKIIRDENKPNVLIANTQRLGPHSKGDDTRSKEEIEKLYQNDPMIHLSNNLKEYEEIKDDCIKEIDSFLRELNINL